MHAAADHYYRRALPIAKRSGSPPALGHTFFASGQGGYYAGQWEQAMANQERSAKAFGGVGHLHWWGASAFFTVLLMLAKGDSRATINSQEIVSIGTEAGDPELHGWGLMGLGMSLRQAGDYGRAIQALEAAGPVLESVHDQFDITVVLAETALCLACQGSFERALHAADRAVSRLAEFDPKGFWKVHAQGPIAEAYLLAAENWQTSNTSRMDLLAKALKAIRACVRDGQRVMLTGWAPDSLRLLATYQWMAGDIRKADKTWQRAMEQSHRLHAPYALAKI